MQAVAANFSQHQFNQRLPCAGWLNVLGQFASTAGAGYLAAVHLGDMIQLASGHILTKQDVFLVYASESYILHNTACVLTRATVYASII